MTKEILFLFLIVIGTVSLIYSLSILCGLSERKNCKEKTKAKVVNVICNFDSPDTSYSFVPLFEFKAKGKEILSSGKIFCENGENFRVGEIREIVYNKNDPNEFYLYNDKFTVKRFIIFFAIGVVLILIGLLILL